MSEELYNALCSWTASVENFLRQEIVHAGHKKVFDQLEKFGADIRLRVPESYKNREVLKLPPLPPKDKP